MKRYIILSIAIFLASVSGFAQVADAPLFRDPITDGAADPVVVYNRNENNWWMLYTQRRANCESAGVAYCFGNKIGVACSDDNGRSWYYRGALDLDFEAGTNTFWAPDVVYQDGVYHMFVVYIRGTYTSFGQPHSHAIMHYTSTDLWNWKFLGQVDVPQKPIIDPTLMQLPDGTWRMWFKYNSKSYYADSKDLFTWSGHDEPAVTGHPHEGAKAFRFKGKYWLVVDEWRGMGVYSSDNYTDWVRQESLILDTPGTRPDDYPSGSHGDVVVCGDSAYVFYFTHPGRAKHTEDISNEIGNIPYELRRSSIQVARLDVVDGQLTVVERDGGVHINLQP